MRKFVLLFAASAALASSIILSAQTDISTDCAEHTTGAAPTVLNPAALSLTICHLNYALHWNPHTRLADYVTYRIDPADISGAVKRRDQFADDPAIPDQLDASLADYAGSGYDRGHLSPAADNTASAQQMTESFYLSNMVPQNQSLNRGAWRILEDRIRNQAKSETITVITGPDRTITKPEIRAGAVLVPENIWKLVIFQNNSACAYWFPNSPAKTAEIPDKLISVAELSSRAQILFDHDISQRSDCDTVF